MKWVSIAVIALCGTLASAQSPAPPSQTAQGEQTISLDRFDQCGFISRFSPNKINPECFQNVNNAVLDQDYSILRRNGYASYLTNPCSSLKSVRGMWPFFARDGSQYLIVLSSNTMYSSKGEGVCTPITGLTNLSSTAQMSCVQGLGYEWCTDGIDPVFRTDVTSTNSISSAPVGNYIGVFRNRIMIGGVSGFLTNVYLSGELDGTDWILPTVTYSTSPAILNISGTNDGQAISCFMGEFQNGYYIGRNYDTYLLSGYDLRDFGISKVDQQIGCMDNNSPQMVNNTLMWLSHRGVESLTGTQINWVSYPIDPTIKVIIQAAGNSQAFTVNSANFTQGNLVASGAGAPISSTIFPGNITVTSATFVDNSTTTFANGTLVNISTIGTSTLRLKIATNTVYGSDFTTGNGWEILNLGSNHAGLNATNNSSIAGTGECNPGSPVNAVVKCPGGVPTCAYMTWQGTGVSPYLRCFGNYLAVAMAVADGATGNILASNVSGAPINLSAVAISSSVIVCLSQAGNQGLTFTNGCLSAGAGAFYSMPVIKQTVTTPVGFVVSVSASLYIDTSSDYQVVTFSSVTVSSYTPTGTYTSASFDTHLTTPTMSNATVGISSNSVARLSIQEQNSDDGVSWSVASTLINGNKALSGKRYWRYIENYTTSNGTMSATSTGVGTLLAETTGYYITPCATTTGNTAWGVFSVNGVTDNGSFTFWISTGASCAAVISPNANWVLQTANSIITTSTSNFAAARVLFNIDSATQAPSINNMSFNWNAGASRPPVASAQYLNKYFMFYTTSQVAGAANDHAIVFDQNSHWQLMDDVHAASASLYLNQLFLGDSQATGKIYLFDSGSDDAGGPFTFSFTTPDLDGGDPISPKTFKRAYVIMGAPTDTTLTGSLTCSYSISGSEPTYPLGTIDLSEAPAQGGYFVAKMPFPSDAPTTGQWINMSCSNSGTVGPIRVFGLKLVYVRNDWP